MSVINDLDSVLLLNANKKVKSYKTKNLIAPGENYGSLMIALDVTLEDGEELPLVAKLIPPNEMIQEFFNTQETFANEIGFYKNVIPALQHFQQEQKSKSVMKCFPRYFGGRISLHPNSTVVDGDAILILENLKLRQFVNLERTVGFDLETAKVLLKDLAMFHAVPLALRLQQAEKFKQDILPHLTVFQCKKESLDQMNNNTIMVAETLPELRPYLDRIRTALKVWPFDNSRELFRTVVHNDMWGNNTMMRLENGKVVDNKLIDFQMCEFTSLAKDLIFFIFSSVQIPVVSQYYDTLVKFYYDEFIRALKELNTDVGPFTFEAFLDEIKYEAMNSQFYHVTGMLVPIFAVKGIIKDISEMTMEHFTKMATNCSDLHKNKLIFLVKEWAKRNWI